MPKSKPLQEQPFVNTVRILYKNPGPDYRKRFEPGKVLTYPHLPDEDIMLLLKIGVLKPAPAEQEQQAEQGAINGEDS